MNTQSGGPRDAGIPGCSQGEPDTSSREIVLGARVQPATAGGSETAAGGAGVCCFKRSGRRDLSAATSGPLGASATVLPCVRARAAGQYAKVRPVRRAEGGLP